MSDLAIQVEHLSKRYRIGVQGTRHDTFFGALASLVKSPITNYRRLHRLTHFAKSLHGQPSAVNGQSLPVPDDSDLIWALENVSFEVKEGEVVGIIGRNGAGKSTLLKILARITEPSSGRALINGRVASLLEVGTGFHAELTGRENIYLNGTILGMTKKEVDAKFDEIVNFAEIEKFIDTPVKHYSSGMYVRLAFAVAAHLEPEILLVDEVLAVGDVAFQKKCLGKMRDISLNEGRTVLLVSHNMSSILQLCPQVIWLEKGKLVQHGDARTIVSHCLRDNNIPLAHYKFPDNFATSAGAKLTEMFLTDESGQIRPDVDYEKPFYIRVRYEVISEVNNLLLGLKLFNSENTVALHAATCDWPETEKGIAGDRGIHEVALCVPGATLAPGRYYCGEIGLWSPDFGHHQHLISSLMTFEIVGGGLRTVGNEVLRPRWKWLSESCQNEGRKYENTIHISS